MGGVRGCLLCEAVGAVRVDMRVEGRAGVGDCVVVDNRPGSDRRPARPSALPPHMKRGVCCIEESLHDGFAMSQPLEKLPLDSADFLVHAIGIERGLPDELVVRSTS